MHHFCTLFDTNYLSRGLTMYHSLKEHCENFHLYIFAFDQNAYTILQSLTLTNVTVISLQQFEDEKLLAVKNTRSVAEYCWTCTSSTILYVLNNFKVDACTYIDADLCFYASPNPIFQELGNKSILLTEHRFTPEYSKDAIKGIYCVQFITFKNNTEGRTALEWWREQCLAWCYARLEDGKFGDQGYLNDWTTRFAGVHVLEHLGGGVAIWNVQQYTFSRVGDQFIGTELRTGKKFTLIFYHFHYLRFYHPELLELGRRTISTFVLSHLYKPYVIELLKHGEMVQKQYAVKDPHGTKPWPWRWQSPFVYLYRKLKGVYYVFSIKDFLQNN